jgi:hypothetical protein
MFDEKPHLIMSKSVTCLCKYYHYYFNTVLYFKINISKHYGHMLYVNYRKILKTNELSLSKLKWISIITKNINDSL